jgi:hypothetical protein
MTEALSAPPYRTRLFALFAPNAPRAVILRRGPRTHYHLIAWDLNTDTFAHGQWMKGVIKLCDLSPRGDKLLYWAAQYHTTLPGAPRDFARTGTAYDPLDAGQLNAKRQVKAWRKRRKVPLYMRSEVCGHGAPRPIGGMWTAISTPPYFSALAIWPSIGTWTGGGVFRSDHELLLRESEDGLTPVENAPMPTTIKARAALIMSETRPCAYNPSLDESEEHKTIARSLAASGVKWLDWISLRQIPDMLFAADGRLYRLKHWANTPEANYRQAAIQIADFRDMRFQLTPAPVSAMQW